MPEREFWALWARAAGFVVLACLLVVAFRPAAGATLRASFYGAESGRRTACGTPFVPMGPTAASRVLPCGTRLRVCFRACTSVTVTDYGPAAWTGRALDLSHGAARAIGLERVGVAQVDVEVLDVTILGGGTVARPVRAPQRHRHHRLRRHR